MQYSKQLVRAIDAVINKPSMYVLVTEGNNIFLTGPFQTPIEASNYGTIAQNLLWNNNPSWRCIDLNHTSGLLVKTPVAFDVVPTKYILL